MRFTATVETLRWTFVGFGLPVRSVYKSRLLRALSFDVSNQRAARSVLSSLIMNSLRLLLSAFMGEEVRVIQVLTYGTDSLLCTFSDASRNSCDSV